MTKQRRFIGWLVLAALVIFADQASKAWLLGTLSYGQQWEITPFFNLVLVGNTGAAFSFLSGAGGWQRWLFAGLAIAISLWIIVMLKQHAAERLLPLALSLVLGGALGNLADRFTRGAVIDFLDFHAAGWHFWAFNVADSAISVGVALMLLQQVLQKPQS